MRSSFEKSKPQCLCVNSCAVRMRERLNSRCNQYISAGLKTVAWSTGLQDARLSLQLASYPQLRQLAIVNLIGTACSRYLLRLNMFDG